MNLSCCFKMERLFVQLSICVVFMVMVEMKAYKACMEKERIGLLDIKATLLNSSCGIIDKLESWVDDDEKSNCCGWDRITCNGNGNITSKRVIGISLYYTTAVNDEGRINGKHCNIDFSSLRPFEELVSLDLSNNGFDSWTNHQGGLESLKKLQVLDLSYNYFNNSILSSVSAFKSLKTLNLGSNRMNGSFPINDLGNLTNFLVLDISQNQFNGNLSEAFCGLRSLLELNLSYNLFFGHLPQCLGNFFNLQALDLSSNQFSGNIQSVISKLKSLKYLYLSDNEFEGMFSFSALANHTKLEIFDLSGGSRMLEVETEIPAWFPTFQLKEFYLSGCSLNKSNRRIPSFLLYQHRLRVIDLSNNKIVGSFPNWILQDNLDLEYLDLHNNSFTGTFQLPSFKHDVITVLLISSNNISGQLPKDIGLFLPNLIYMDVSKNSFEGNFPSSICKAEQLVILDLSRNNLSGEIPGCLFRNSARLVSMSLSNNNFQGNIFTEYVHMTSLRVLHMDNNNFSVMEDVGLFFMPLLLVLDISKNNIAGEIPIYLRNMRNLTYLDLSENRLTGSLPSCFAATSLRYLFLQKNGLNGVIPHVLFGCPYLEIIDLSGNKFSGNIPYSIGQLSELVVLLLGGNALQGHIPNQLCHLRKLNMLGLSHNKIDGSIPSCLNNISFGNMIEPNIGPFFPESPNYSLFIDMIIYWLATLEVHFITKCKPSVYGGGIIGNMSGLDLSHNQLTGEIPSEIGELQELRSMNLSYNHLSGSIPVTFSNLKNLESLDLQSNNLSGQIPPQLSGLNFLEIFDVSYNNLSGMVPFGGQFGTFIESSYNGNPALCGCLIRRCCKATTPVPSIDDVDDDDDDESAIDVVWFYSSFSASYVTVLLGKASVLCINPRWRNLWFYYVDLYVYAISN